MKILIVTDTYYPHVNGASYFAQRLSYYLKLYNHEVAVIAPSETYKNTSKIIDGIKVFGVSSLPIFFYPGFRFALPIIINKYIKNSIFEFKPDVIHLQSHFAINRAAIRLAEKNRIPMVITNHFMPENLLPFLPLPKFILEFLKNIAWWDFARIFKKADAVTSPTETAAHLIDTKLGIPVRAISCGIDLNRFSIKNNGEYLRSKFNISSQPILIYVGRLDKDKNLDFVLRAFKKSIEKSNLNLLIVGKGSEQDNLKKLSIELGVDKRVIFTGFISNEDLPNVYTLANCAISPGTAELQSISTMEAMASGLPVIAVNSVALPELVKDGKNGFLYSVGDVDALSEKIIKIFSDDGLCKKMGEESLKIIAKHDIKKVISEYENLYIASLSKGRKII